MTEVEKIDKRIKKIEEKILKLSPYQRIMLMVKGLENPKTEISMITYGHKIGNICYGCAATNALLTLDFSLIDNITTTNNIGLSRFNVIYKSSVIIIFEVYIDELRSGKIPENKYNSLYTTPIVNPNNLDLPYLSNEYTQEQLNVYKQLAKDNLKYYKTKIITK